MDTHKRMLQQLHPNKTHELLAVLEVPLKNKVPRGSTQTALNTVSGDYDTAVLDAKSISTWKSLSIHQQYASFLPLFWIKTVRESQPSTSDGSIEGIQQAVVVSFRHW